MIATRDTTPVILAGTTPLLSANTSGAAVFLPSSGLANPFSTPIEVTALRFLQSTVGSTQPARCLDVALRAGRHDLTNGFCPLYAIAPQYDTAEETMVNIAVAPIFVVTVRWIFPRGMILLPGASVSGAVRINPALNLGAFAGTIALTAVVIARHLPGGTPTPRRTFIPFASGAAYVGAVGPIANDLQLMNTLRAPLHVTQINAATLGLGVVRLESPIALNMQLVGPGGVLGTPRRTVFSSLSGNVAFAQRRSIEVSHVLKPKESYKVTVATASAFTMAVAISGYREEVL
jgi:hypothetical protein